MINKEELIEEEKKFTKKAFLKSNEYKKDIINAILDDDKAYTKKEVKKLIDKYLKGSVM